MTDTLDLQAIYGKLAELDSAAPEGFEVKVALNRELVLYKNEFQIVGDERTTETDQDGNWRFDLLDTDGMEEETYYIFNINGRIYRKLVPVSAVGWEFADLPFYGG